MKEIKFMVIILILVIILPFIFDSPKKIIQDDDCWWTFKGYSLCEYQKSKQK